MPKTQFSTYDSDRLIQLAERIEAFCARYRALAQQLGTEKVELPNQRGLENALVDLRTHIGRAELKVEELLDDDRRSPFSRYSTSFSEDIERVAKSIDKFSTSVGKRAKAPTPQKKAADKKKGTG